jgi:carbonic anhydrase
MPIPKLNIDLTHSPTAETIDSLTPEDILKILVSGNNRFLFNLKLRRNLMDEVKETIFEQHPYAVILSCIDSRVSPELIFDLGIGDIFDVRVAGNFINDDIIGSIEYACKFAGSKLVLIMGHTGCGAVKGTIDNVNVGKVASLVKNIKPALDLVGDSEGEISSKNGKLVDRVSLVNVELSIKNLLAQSEIINEMYESKQIKVVGGLYHLDTGKVEFYEK